MSKDYFPCWFCSELFGRQILTKRKCNNCGKYYCEGTHGIITKIGAHYCVYCITNIKDIKKQEK